MASGGIYAETLELPIVPELVVNGSTFVKWDDDSGAVQSCTAKVDCNGHILFWKYEDKAETDLLDIVQIRDVRTGKYARMPKDAKVKELIKSKLPSNDVNFEDYCISVVYGPNMVETYSINFVALTIEEATVWFDCLMSFCEHVLAANASPLKFLEKHYTKLVVHGNPDGAILVKLVTKYIATNKEDKKRVYDTLQSLGLPCKKDDVINIEEFGIDTFYLFMNRLCNRQDIDKIFAEIGAKKKPYLTAAQFVDFLNKFQRDPRLNEILFPYYDNARAQSLIDTHEPNKQFAEKGHLSVQGFARYLMSEDNAVVSTDRLALHQDMTAPLSHYFINSSHNTYLTGHQLTGKSSVEIYRQALMSGCRCVELDCWDGKTQDQEPYITHGKTLCTEILFKDVIEAIAESAFKTSDYPVILSFENHCSRPQQRKMAQYCVSIFGDMLLNKTIDEYPLDDGKLLPSPKALTKKILIKNKKKQLKSYASEATGIQDGSIPGNNTENSTTTEGEFPSSEVTTDELSDSLKSESEALKDILDKSGTKKDVDQLEEVESENVLSDLVNYVQPVHFKGFDYAETRNKSFEMTSFVETVATTLLKQQPVEFVNYNKRQLSRIYPKGTRVGSENYMPQIFWNAGCQLVALNFQTLDVPMMLNLGKFEYNGRCGYLRKPDFMCRTDRSFDPFAESTVDGIIAGAVEVKVLSGQFLSDRKVGTYVEVEMYGLPADTVRRKYRTKAVAGNGINPVYDEEAFHFPKVVLPSLAILRVAAYEESGKLIGHRVLPVGSIQPGYRHIKLKNDCYQPLCLPVVFVHIMTRDYVPSGFSDFADALANPIAFQTKAEIRGHMLETLMDDDEAPSQVPEMKPKGRLAADNLPSSLRRASNPVVVPSSPGFKSHGVKTSMSTGNLNGMPHGGCRSMSLAVDQPDGNEQSSKIFKRSQSTKKREEDPKIIPIPIDDLRSHKNLQKVKEKQNKDMSILVKKHIKEKDKLQRQHFMIQEKLAKEMERDVEITKKKLDKALKKASKAGNYEEVYRDGLKGVTSLRKEHEMRMNVLKLEQREEVIRLIESQLKDQHDLAKENIEPEFEELVNVMELTKNEQSKKLSDHHDRKMQELRRIQDAYNRYELKEVSKVSKEKKSKDEIQRLKREQNKRHIEQAVKERQKESEFHQKEMQQLLESHDNLISQVGEYKQKCVEDLLLLYQKRCRNIRNADLEIVYASLFAENEEVSKL